MINMLNYKCLIKDYPEYYKLFKERKADNTTLNLYDYLKENYPYLYEEVLDDEYSTSDDTFTLFNEIIFEEKVVGFFTVNAIEDSAIISNVYITPQYRRKGLFILEFTRFYMYFGHLKIVFLNPNSILMESLVKYNLALDLDDVISSYFSLATVIDDDGRRLLRESYYYSKKKNAVIVFSDDEDFESAELKSDSTNNHTNYMNSDKRYSINDFRKFKKVISDNIEDIYDFGERIYKTGYLRRQVQDTIYPLYIYDEDENFNIFYENMSHKYHLDRYFKAGLADELVDNLENWQVLPESFHIHMKYVFEHKLNDRLFEEYDDENYTTCPVCRKIYDNKFYCRTCGFNREFTKERVEFIKSMDSYPDNPDDRDFLKPKIKNCYLNEIFEIVKDNPNAKMDDNYTHHLYYDELKYLEDNDYITETFDRKYYANELEKLNMKCLKAMLKFENLRTSGKKADLIDRIMCNCSMDTITRFMPFKVYVLTDKGLNTDSFTKEDI